MEKEDEDAERENSENLDNTQESLDNILKEEGVKKETTKKQNSQVKWAILLMTAVIIIIFLVPFIVREMNKFEYIGLEFQKTKLGDIIFYSTRFPVVDIQGAVTGDYSINFRSDPREHEEYILIDVPDREIKFMKNHEGGINPVYLAIDPNMTICDDSAIAMMNLAGFLRHSDLEVRSAVTNSAYAEENNYEFVSCIRNPANTVIKVRGGNQTAIYKTMKNCYEIVFSDCEIIPVAEKFVLLMLEEYMSHFRVIGTDEPVIKDRENNTNYFNIDLKEGSSGEEILKATGENAEEENTDQQEELDDLLGLDQIF